MPLREDVKELPPCVLKRLLAIEALQLQLENKAYALLLAWLWQSPHVHYKFERLPLFKELAPLLLPSHDDGLSSRDRVRVSPDAGVGPAVVGDALNCRAA